MEPIATSIHSHDIAAVDAINVKKIDSGYRQSFLIDDEHNEAVLVVTENEVGNVDNTYIRVYPVSQSDEIQVYPDGDQQIERLRQRIRSLVKCIGTSIVIIVIVVGICRLLYRM